MLNNKDLGKICVLSNDYPSDGRPTYVFVEQLINTLADKGVEVCVVAPQSLARCLFHGVKILSRCRIHETPQGHYYKVYRPYSLSFGNGKKILYCLAKGFNRKELMGCLNRIRPDILYGHFWNNAYLLKEYAFKNKLPLFVACGEGDNAMEELINSLSLMEKKELVDAVHGVISVSTENKRKCIDYGLAKEENIIVLPNSVDTHLFHPREKNIKLRKKLGVEEDDFLILFVGGFIPRKGSGILAKAIDKLGDSHVKVIYIGATMPGDEDDPQCNGIVFKGRVPHDKLPDYYACADVFVLPTQKEGCSNAIVEALAMGLPVISSIGAFNDDILNKSNSIRIKPTCVDDISNAIATLRDNHGLRQQLAKGAICTAKYLNINNRAERIMLFIKQQTQ